MKTLTTIIVLTVISTSACYTQTWLEKANYPLPQGGDGSVSFVIDEKIYVAGGFNSNALFEYDRATNTWTQKSAIPGADNSRSFSAGFSISGKGYLGMGLDINSAGTSYACKKDLWEYDPQTDSWTEKAAYPGSACCAFITFVIANKAYIGAGEVPHYNEKKDMYVYDPALDTWAPVADYPGGRSGSVKSKPGSS